MVAAKYFNQVAPITQKETDDLADLKPADDVKDDWQVVVDKQKEGNDFLKTIRDKAEAKDRSGLQDLQKAPAIGQDFAAAAKKIGAVDCAAAADRVARRAAVPAPDRRNRVHHLAC